METVLRHLLWNALEATVLAGLLAGALRFSKPGPVLRHALWLLVILKLIVPPFLPGIPLGLGAACGGAARSVGLSKLLPGREDGVAGSIVGAATLRSPLGAVERASDLLEGESLSPGAEPPGEVLAEARVESPVEYRAPGEGSALEPVLRAATGSVALPAPRGTSGLMPQVGWAALLWLSGSIVFLAAQCVRIALFQRRLLAMAPPAAWVAAECGALARRLRLRRVPRLKVDPRPSSPMVYAFGFPTVIIPAGVTAQDRRELLRSILLHELAHLRRRDHWICWIELLASGFYWWLPTLWVARSRVRSAADQSADAWAARELGSRKSYAESLLEAVHLFSARADRGGHLARGMNERQSLERRLVMIMKEPLLGSLSWKSWLVVAAAAAIALPAGPRGLPGQEVGGSGAYAGADDAPVSPKKLSRGAPRAQAAGKDDPDGARATADPNSSTDASTPAPGGPQDLEARLSDLEDKVGLILKELKSFRRADGNGSANHAVPEPAQTAPRAKGAWTRWPQTADPTLRMKANVYDWSAGARMKPPVYSWKQSGDQATYSRSPLESLPGRTELALRQGARLNLSAEQRVEIEKLEQTHRKALEDLEKAQAKRLREILSPEQVEQIDQIEAIEQFEQRTPAGQTGQYNQLEQPEQPVQQPPRPGARAPGAR